MKSDYLKMNIFDVPFQQHFQTEENHETQSLLNFKFQEHTISGEIMNYQK